MANIIQIKCPFDGAILTVMHQPGLEYKNVTCPICKHTYPFTEFKRINTDQRFDETRTRYSKDNLDEHTVFKREEKKVQHEENLILGHLKSRYTHQNFQLRPGRNVIGRKSSKSNADFMLDTVSDRRMSREHILIEVKRIPDKGYVHYLSLFKEKTNPTYVGNEPIYFGDCIVLKDGDIIRLPGIELIFELPDPEETDYRI